MFIAARNSTLKGGQVQVKLMPQSRPCYCWVKILTFSIKHMIRRGWKIFQFPIGLIHASTLTHRIKVVSNEPR